VYQQDTATQPNEPLGLVLGKTAMLGIDVSTYKLIAQRFHYISIPGWREYAYPYLCVQLKLASLQGTSKSIDIGTEGYTAFGTGHLTKLLEKCILSFTRTYAFINHGL
jgi:hypothetical protein